MTHPQHAFPLRPTWNRRQHKPPERAIGQTFRDVIWQVRPRQIMHYFCIQGRRPYLHSPEEQDRGWLWCMRFSALKGKQNSAAKIKPADPGEQWERPADEQVQAEQKAEGNLRVSFRALEWCEHNSQLRNTAYRQKQCHKIKCAVPLRLLYSV